MLFNTPNHYVGAFNFFSGCMSFICVIQTLLEIEMFCNPVNSIDLTPWI